MIKRKYGNTHTSLTLSDKAQRLYSDTDPFDIFEYEDNDGILTYSYRWSYDAETRRMTEAVLNADLEALADGIEMALGDQED